MLNKYLGRTIGIINSDRVKARLIRAEFQQKPILHTVENKLLHWHGHICRVGDSRLGKSVYEARRRGIKRNKDKSDHRHIQGDIRCHQLKEEAY